MRYVFTYWGNGDTSQSITFAMTKDTLISAVTKLQFKVQTQTFPSGLVSIAGEGWKEAGCTLTVSAPALPNYTFTAWEINGDTVGANATVSVIADEPKNIVAIYQPLPAWTFVTSGAAFVPRDGAGLINFHGKMWLLGGWHEEAPQLNSEVWNSADGQNWTCVQWNAAWPARHCAGYVVYDDKMWIMSGDGFTDVWNSSDGITWNLVTDVPPWGKRYKPYVLTFDNKIWLMGGMDYADSTSATFHDGLNDVWSTTDGINWTRVTEQASWAPRGLIHGTAVFGGKMWVIGGGHYAKLPNPSVDETYYNDVWWSTDGISWTCATYAAPWISRIHHTVAAFDGKLWVIAGHHKPDPGLLNDVWYSTDGTNWREMPGTPWTPRHAASAVEFNNSLYLVAGYLVNDVWRLSKP
jgi:hypothetical protein